MTQMRPLMILLTLIFLSPAACYQGEPEKDVALGDNSEGDAHGDLSLDAPDELLPLDVPEDTPDPLDIPDLEDPDLSDEILEEVQEDVEQETVETPCASHVECDDGDPCTGDFCEDEICTHYLKDCGDANECTEDLCDPATGQCSYELTDCDDGNECTLDSCKPATGCEYIDLDDCCPPEVVAFWDMEEATPGLEITNLQPDDSPAVTWQTSAERASPP